MKKQEKESTQTNLFDRVIGIINHDVFGKIEIRETNDYESLKDIPSNRGINTGHVKRILKSMLEQMLFTIIFVNENLQIIDGQHRKVAAKLAKKPIVYAIIKGYGESEISRYNSNSKTWTYDDYADHYSQIGLETYEKYRKFKLRYKLGHSVTMTLLSGSMIGGDMGEKFKAGTFEIKNYTFAMSIAEKLQQLSFYPGYNSRNFVFAFLELHRYDNYDWDRFRENFKNYHKSILDGVGGGVRNYLTAFEGIYNYHRRDKEMIYDHLKYA